MNTPWSSQSFRALNAWKEEFLVTCAPPQPETFPFVVVGNKCDKPKPKVQCTAPTVHFTMLTRHCLFR